MLARSACGTRDNGFNVKDLQSDGTVDKAGTVDNQAVAIARDQPADNTQNSVADAAISDLYEVQPSRLVSQKALSASVRRWIR